MVITLLVIIGFVIAVLGFFISLYNRLIWLRNRVKNGWSQIDVQLKRRYDLIPNLLELVKGYMKYEQETLEKVIKARQQAVNISAGGNIAEQAKAENLLTQTLRSLFALVENYPDLKANQNMLQLQEELTSTENKIAFARQYYNDEVMRYNSTLETFPVNIIAGKFNFKKEEFFEIEELAEKGAPQVKF